MSRRTERDPMSSAPPTDQMAGLAVSMDRPEPSLSHCSKALTIVIIDRQTLFRRGLGLLLRQWYPKALFGEAGDIATLLPEVAQRPAPGVLLVEAALAAQHEFAGLGQLIRHIPSSPIMLLAEETDPAAAATALQLGARGYLPKAASEDHLRHALALVLSGEAYAPPGCLLQQPRGMRERHVPPGTRGRQPLQMLTRREREVLLQLSQGRSNKEIGLRLGMVESTVKVHVKAILKKLSATNRTQAAMLMLANPAGTAATMPIHSDRL
jgi:two-component system nitrate/nitrite response regulator NarL